MTHAPRPNRRAEDAGNLLAGIIATNLTAALEHLARELQCADGFGERGDNVAVHTSGVKRPTEAAMAARYELTEAREGLRDALDEAVEAIRRLGWAAQAAMRLRAPQDVVRPSTAKLCRDGITDRTRAWAMQSPDHATCMRTQERLGLCEAHYKQRRRWMESLGIIEPDAEEELVPVGVVRSTAEVVIRDGVDGVVHVRPVRIA